MKKETIWGLLLLAPSRWDRYLGMTAAMTQVPVPTASFIRTEMLHFTVGQFNSDAFDTFTTSGFQRITDLLNEEK